MLSLLLFSYSSCTDQGCIEADDFGEYEQEVLTVRANNLGESCEYRPDQPLDSIDQGSGLKTCFNPGGLISGNVQIVDEQGAEQNSSTGCIGFENSAHKNICVEQCRQSCINQNSADSSGAEPDWVSTSKKQSGKNVGVTIAPGAKIYIRAIGTVILGGDKPNPIFTRSTENSLQSKKGDFSGMFFDLKRSVSKDVKFSGKWTINNSGNTFGGDIATQKSATFEGARRLVAYTVPHPTYYNFDTSATSEIAGTKGTPLFADTRLWTCSYTGSTLKQSSCLSLDYSPANGYPTTNNLTAQSYYGISSTKKADNLGKSGGMIRWDNDGLEAFSIDPFAVAGTTCGTTCTNLPGSAVGGIVGDLNVTARASIKNNETYPVRILFKNLGSAAGSDTCNLGVAAGTTALSATITYKDSNGADASLPAQNITINKTSWSTDYITLEAGDTMTFATNSANFSSTNCGRVIAYRLDKLQEITIQKSGFLSFTRLATSGSSGIGSCNLKGRIINPKGSRANDPINAFDNDFYEYDPFGSSSSNDPIRDLAVPISNSTVGTTPFDKTWSDKVFVRKGQVIRFDPTSWNGSWVTGSGGTRQCGIGTVMKVGGIDMVTGKVDDRPAFLCRGVSTDMIPNPLCKIGSDGNCQRYSEYCSYDPVTRLPKGDGSKFCPIESCQENFTCTSPSGSCNCASSSPLVTSGTCSACKAAKDAAGGQPKTVPLSLSQCYDLENYNGKVSNIPNSTGFTPEQLADSGIAKGAKKLGAFNGSYGNFENFTDTGTTESATYNNNKIYHLSQQIYADVDSRLFFLLIDNNDFGDTVTSWYNDNGASGSSYNGLNGYKIDLSGQQEFKNGQWLEAILCQEADGGDSCSSFDVPTQVNDQPNIVTVVNPTTSGAEPQITSRYQFDPYGSILSQGFTGTNPATNSLSQTASGDNFYRHSYDGTSTATGANNSSSEKSKRLSNLKISFKIKDSEVPNCDMGNPALGQNSCSAEVCGVVVENRFYDSTVSSNVDRICGAGTTIGGGSGDCKKQFFCGNKYYNNSGQYQVVVKVENKDSNISDIVDQVVSPVIEIMDGKADGSTIGQAERVYKSIVNDSRFQAIVQLMVILMITFYGVGYLMGVSEFSQGEIVSRIIKIGIIYLFISPTGWIWFDKFFVNFFKHGTDYVTFLMASSFDRSAELSNAIANNSFHDKSILFGGIDKVFGMFFSSAVQKKISALLFASIFGPVYLYIIYLSFFLYVYAVANAVLLYLTAQVFISILFVLGPLFFIMLFFNQTKEMFDKWLSELIGFSLQQVFLLTTLAFFNMMMYEIIKMALGYRICWDDVWVINIYITRIKLLSFWTIASMPSRLSLQSDIGNIGNPEGIPSLFSILFIYIIASLMHKFIDFMTNLGASIGGSLKASAMGSGIKAAGAGAMKNAKKIYQDGFDGKGGIGSAIDGKMQSVDRALFDSGKKADKDRADKKEQSTKDRANRNTLTKAGDKAVSDFKKDPANALALKNASPEEQNKMLQAHRNSEMQKKAGELGLNEKDTKRLMEQKASFGGDTLLDAAKNAWKDRDIKNKSMSEKDADTKLSGSEFRAAMKGAKTPEEKAKLAEGANDGSLKVDVSLKDKAAQSLDKAKEEFKDGNKMSAAGSALKAAGQGIGAGAGAVLSPLTKVAEPFKAAASAAKAGAQLAKGVAGKSSYDKARNDLVEKGEIADRKYGTGWAASDKDKAKIKDRMQERTAEKSIQSEKVSSSTANFVARETGEKAVTKLDRNTEYQSKLKDEMASAQATIRSGGSKDEVKNAQTKVDKLDKEIGKSEKKVDKLSPPKAPTTEASAPKGPLGSIPEGDDE